MKTIVDAEKLKHDKEQVQEMSFMETIAEAERQKHAKELKEQK